MSQAVKDAVSKLKFYLNEIASQEVSKLERADLGPFNFQRGNSSFQQVIEFAKDLSSLPLDILPIPVIEMITSQGDDAIRLLNLIKEFDPATVNNPKPQRDDLLNEAVRSFDNFRQQTLPYVGYLFMKKGDESLTRAGSLVKDIEAQFNSEILKAREANSQIATTLESARAAAGEVGVKRHSIDFKTIAEKHRTASYWWLVVTSLLIAGVALCSLLFISHWLPDGDLKSAAIVQRLVSKVVFLSSLYFAIVFAARNYRANKHLAVVNEHRQTSLQTFETFISSAGDDIQTKNAVLLETTRTIFSPAVSGYLGAEEENPNNRIVEILKLAGSSSGK